MRCPTLTVAVTAGFGPDLVRVVLSFAYVRARQKFPDRNSINIIPLIYSVFLIIVKGIEEPNIILEKVHIERTKRYFKYVLLLFLGKFTDYTNCFKIKKNKLLFFVNLKYFHKATDLMG